MVRRIRSHKQKLEGAEKPRPKPRDDRDAVIARLEEQAAASDIDPAEIARHYFGQLFIPARARLLVNGTEVSEVRQLIAAIEALLADAAQFEE